MTRLATALAATFALCAAGAAARDCAISAIEGGAASLWHDGAWRGAAPGPLPGGEVKLRTESGARLEIACDDGLTLTVAPDSEVNLEALAGAAGPERDVILQLLHGLIGVIAPERTWRRLETRTPLAIAAARTTAWFVEAAPGGPVAVFVADGAVAVRPSGDADFQSVTLAEGEGLTVRPDGSADPAAAWGAERIEAGRAALGFGWR